MRTPHPLTAPRRRAATAFCLVSALVAVLPAAAGADDHSPNPKVTQTNLVANNDEYGATIVDPSLVNVWGMSKFPTSPVWVSNNHDDSSTLYRGGSAADPAGVAKVPLRVDVDGGPTGQVANPTTGFVLPNGQPSLFIFATEEGELYGWNQAAGTTAVETASVAGGNFKGLAQGMIGANSYLYAADFTKGSVDVFDASWNKIAWPGAFRVNHLPAGYAPFNVQVLTDPLYHLQRVFVAYAKRNPVTNDEIAGPGRGLVAEFSTFGTLIRTFDRKDMNAPWGLAIAPSGWAGASGQLLVGQFGNGRVEVYDLRTGKHRGTVRDAKGHKLVIDGLWALLPGDATSGGVGSLLFTAGPDDESDGLYGVLMPAPDHHGH